MRYEELLELLSKTSIPGGYSLPLYDAEHERMTEGSYLFTSSFKDRAVYLLASHLGDYSLSVPFYKDDLFSLLLERGNERIIYHFCLDSENERAAWRLLDLKVMGYDALLIRAKEHNVHSSLPSISISELFAPLNF